MNIHMANTRTTFVLDRRRLMELKRLAAEQGRTLSSVVDEVLRLGLHDLIATKRSGKRKSVQSIKYSTFPAVMVECFGFSCNVSRKLGSQRAS